MDQVETDSVATFILAQTAAGEVADFTRREGYSAESKPIVKAEFLRQLLLGRLDGAKVLRPGVRIVGVQVDGPVDLRDCAGDGLPALCLEACDFSDAISLSNSRLARLSLRASRICALIAYGLSADGDVDFSDVTPFPAAVPIAFVDLRSARISGSVIGRGAKLKALAAEHNSGGLFTTFALDLSLATVNGGVLVDHGFTAEGGAALISAEIAGLFQCSAARFTSAIPGGFALAASAVRVGGAVLLDGASAAGLVDFTSARIGGNLHCSGAVLSCVVGDALHCGQAHIGGAVMLDSGFSANGLVDFGRANIEGSLGCRSAQFNNKGSTALSAEGARIGCGVFFDGMTTDGAVSLMNARVGLILSIWGASISYPLSYALNLQTARVDGELQAFNNKFEGAVSLSGARIGRLYDIADTAWMGATAIDLNELTYTAMRPRPWFVFADGTRPEQNVEAKSKKRPIWRVRAEWLKLNTGKVGEDKCPFSNQPWRECAAALARAGHYADARRLAREEQREANRQRIWWKRPFVWLCAEQAFGSGLSVTRATVTSLLFWLVGWAGADLMLKRNILVDMRDTPKVCTSIDPAVYALDVAIPVLDLKEESSCEPGRHTNRALLAPAPLPVIGALKVDEVAFWRWIKALYATVGAIVIGFTILTYSGVFRPKSDA